MRYPMPCDFPEDTFAAFGRLATALFPNRLSDEDLNGRLECRRQVDQACHAVRHRYRACSDSSAEYRALFDGVPAQWSADIGHEEHDYKIERCLYVFFTSAVSVFDSLTFSLYFIGSVLDAEKFRSINNPRNITVHKTVNSFTKAFPGKSITAQLSRLEKDLDYKQLCDIRNVLAHRLVGMRNIRSSGITRPDGSNEHERWEVWHLAGAGLERTFDRGMTQRRLNAINRLLLPLINASVEFVEGHQPSAPVCT